MNSEPQTPYEIDSAEIRRFFKAFAPWSHLYDYPVFSFLAIKEGGVWSFVEGTVFLVPRWDSKVKPKGFFETEQLLVGQVLLSRAGLTIERFIESVRSGEIKVGKYVVTFALDGSQRATPHFIEFEQQNAVNGRRAATLSLVGMQRMQSINKAALDWHLKSHAYDSLDELCMEYGVGQVQQFAAKVQIQTGTVVEALIGAVVKDGWATPSVLITGRTEKSKVSLAYRVFASGKIVERGLLTADVVEAGRAGVVLLTRDELQNAVTRSFAPTDADGLWDQLNQEAKNRLSQGSQTLQ